MAARGVKAANLSTELDMKSQVTPQLSSCETNPELPSVPRADRHCFPRLPSLLLRVGESSPEEAEQMAKSPDEGESFVSENPEHRLLITINILPLLFIDFEQKLQNQYFHTNLFFVFFFEILIDLIFFDFLIDFEIMNLLIF